MSHSAQGVAALAEEQGGEGAATGFMIGAGFGMAAYMIENPAEAVDPESDRVQGAGLESGLRWFEAYRRRGQAHGAPILEELIELRSQGRARWRLQGLSSATTSAAAATSGANHFPRRVGGSRRVA
jgi:hypothetical protein